MATDSALACCCAISAAALSVVLRKPAGQAALEFGRLVGVTARYAAKRRSQSSCSSAPHSRAFQPSYGGGRYLERRDVQPSAARVSATSFLAERLPVREIGAGAIGRTLADRRLAADQRRTIA